MAQQVIKQTNGAIEYEIDWDTDIDETYTDDTTGERVTQAVATGYHPRTGRALREQYLVGVHPTEGTVTHWYGAPSEAPAGKRL